MKDGRKFVVGQETISFKMLDRALAPDAMLMAVAKRAKRKMEEAMDQENLVVAPDEFSVIVRVVVECIAIPKESSDGV